MSKYESPENPLLSIIDNFVQEVESQVIPALPIMKVIIYKMEPKDLKFEGDIPKYTPLIERISEREIPYINSKSFYSFGSKLINYQKLYMFTQVLTNYPASKINQILFNIYSNYYYAKYIEGIENWELLRKLHNYSFFYYAAEALNPYLPNVGLAYFSRSDLEDFMNKIYKQIKEKLSAAGVKVEDLPKKLNYIHHSISDSSATQPVIAIKIMDFLQGIQLEGNSKIQLDKSTYLRNIQSDDLSFYIYDPIDITYKEEIPEFYKNTNRWRSIFLNWEYHRSKMIYTPSSVMEFEQEVSFYDLVKKILEIRVLIPTLSLYNIGSPRVVCENFYLKLSEDAYVPLQSLEFLGYILGEQDKNIYPFKQYQLVRQRFWYSLKLDEIGIFESFVRDFEAIIHNFLINITFLSKTKPKNKQFVLSILNALFEKQYVTEDIKDIPYTIARLISSLEVLISKKDERLRSKELIRRVTKLLTLLGVDEHDEISGTIRRAYDIRSHYVHGRLISKNERNLTGLSDLLRKIVKYLNILLIIDLLLANEGKNQNWLPELIDKAFTDPKKHGYLKKFLEELTSKKSLRSVLPHYFTRK